MSVLLAGVLTMGATLLWWPRASRERLAGLGLACGASPAVAVAARRPDGQRRAWWMSPWLSALVAAFAVSRMLPGPEGYVAATMAAVAVAAFLRTATSAADLRRLEQVERDLPLAVDLLVSCVAAGQPPGRALVAIAASVGGPVGEDLRAFAGRLELGADPMVVWRDLADDATFAPLGRCLARSARTGSSISAALARCADDLRRARRTAADANARKVSVRASAPLGACFLPAFFLVGVLPTIIGSVRSISW